MCCPHMVRSDWSSHTHHLPHQAALRRAAPARPTQQQHQHNNINTTTSTQQHQHQQHQHQYQHQHQHQNNNINHQHQYQHHNQHQHNNIKINTTITSTSTPPTPTLAWAIILRLPLCEEEPDYHNKLACCHRGERDDLGDNVLSRAGLPPSLPPSLHRVSYLNTCSNTGTAGTFQ